MEIKSFYGLKQEQIQTFDNEDKRLVVTVIKTLPLKITQLKTSAKDGYWALQVRVASKKRKPILKEVRLSEEAALKKGEEISLNQVFKPGDLVQVQGVTKGKGFAGVVKRWGFAGGPHTHGQSDRERAPGSIGMRTTPGRVWKGKKMPGHMGNKQKTIKGLKVFKIDEDKNELWITGLVPGGRRGVLKISKLEI